MVEISTATDSQCVHRWLDAVVATMRDLRKRGPLEKAAGDSLNKTLEIKELDACCEESIRECVNSLPDRRVDVLGPSPLIHILIDSWSELKMSPIMTQDSLPLQWTMLALAWSDHWSAKASLPWRSSLTQTSSAWRGWWRSCCLTWSGGRAAILWWWAASWAYRVCLCR